jgi:predicted ester cyclase
MSEQNKTIVRRFYDEVMSQGKVEVLDEIMVEDFIDHGETLLGSPRGLDTLKQSIRGSRDVFLDLTVTLHDVIASGDMVGVRGTMRCTQQGEFLGVPATGNEISWSGLAMFRVVDGKIAER